MRLRKSALITKLLLLALAVFAITSIVKLQPQIEEKKQQRDVLAQQVEAAKQKNLSLQQDIDQLGTDEAVRKIARERLNLVDDGEIVFVDIGN